MNESTASARAMRFGAFEVDLLTGELRKQGSKLKLQEQPFQILVALLENTGNIVTREDLRQKLWPGDTFGDSDHSLNNCINKLREALGDSATSPRFIETLARRGYRFIAPVEIVTLPSPAGELTPGPELAQPQSIPRRVSYWRALTAAGIVLALLAVIALWAHAALRQRLGRQADIGAVHSLAVLPLENLSGDPAQDYLADSMTDQLITELAGVRALRITSRTSVMRFKGVSKHLREIAADLNVDTIVEGSVLRLGPRVRISAQLIQASSDRHLWADTYERDLRDVLGLEREVALAITRQIRIRLTPLEKGRLTNTSPVNAEAQEAYFLGRYCWNTRTREGLEKAIKSFEQAIERDPTYAQAYSGLADSFVLLGSRSFLPPKDAFLRAKTAAIKALALDNTLAEAHAAPAFAGLYYDWDWVDAEREFRRAIELNPSYSNAHHWYSHFLTAMGRTEESLAESRMYLDLDPLNSGARDHLGWHFLYSHQYDRAIEQDLKAINMDARPYRAYETLGRAYEQKGMHAQALAALDKAVAASKEASVMLASQAAGYAAAGRRNDALRIVNLLKLQSRNEYVPAYGLAEVYAVLGDKNEAFAWLERAYNERSSWLVYMKVEPRLDRLRSDMRFQSLLQRMRLVL